MITKSKFKPHNNYYCLMFREEKNLKLFRFLKHVKLEIYK